VLLNFGGKMVSVFRVYFNEYFVFGVEDALDSAVWILPRWILSAMVSAHFVFVFCASMQRINSTV